MKILSNDYRAETKFLGRTVRTSEVKPGDQVDVIIPPDISEKFPPHMGTYRALSPDIMTLHVTTRHERVGANGKVTLFIQQTILRGN